ncbi:23086_t:CDS:2 [Rhizophagus irregularis]|nr:23086_t:CDS:2 [Rhizophagus irregularis]
MRLHPLAESRVVMALLSLESGDERLEISIEELPGDGLYREGSRRGPERVAGQRCKRSSPEDHERQSLGVCCEAYQEAREIDAGR